MDDNNSLDIMSPFDNVNLNDGLKIGNSGNFQINDGLDFFSKIPFLPKDLYLVTTVVTCKWNTYFNIEAIKTKIADSKNFRLIVKKKSFANQISVEIMFNINDNEYEYLKKMKKKKLKKLKTINVKIFINGSLQITGCRRKSHYKYGIETLVKKLKYDKDGNYTYEYSSNPKNIGMSEIGNFKVRLINSKFDSDYIINGKELYKCLKDKIVRIYEPCVHACVNIKFPYSENEKVSIFVFEKGSVIITGSKSLSQTFSAYGYSLKMLIEEKDKIQMLEFKKFSSDDKINKIIKNYTENSTVDYSMIDNLMINNVTTGQIK